MAVRRKAAGLLAALGCWLGLSVQGWTQEVTLPLIPPPPASVSNSPAAPPPASTASPTAPPAAPMPSPEAAQPTPIHFSGREVFPVSQQEAAQPKGKEDTLVFPKQQKVPVTGNPFIRSRSGGDEEVGFPVQTDLPGINRWSRRESEAQMFQRIREETDRPGSFKAYFPEETLLAREKYKPRAFQPRVALVEPAYVAHGRLLFEQRNFDRHGWELGVLQPGVSLLGFYYDLAMMPYHMWSRPLDQYEVSAGKCLPGDTVPLLLYPETFSVSGLAGMATTFMAGPFIFR